MKGKAARIKRTKRRGTHLSKHKQDFVFEKGFFIRFTDCDFYWIDTYSSNNREKKKKKINKQNTKECWLHE